MLNDIELGWVAGLIEVEGSFTVKKSKRKNGYSCQPQLRVSMTDEDVVRKLAALIPAGNVLKAGRRNPVQVPGSDRPDDRSETMDGEETSGTDRFSSGSLWFHQDQQ